MCVGGRKQIARHKTLPVILIRTVEEKRNCFLLEASKSKKGIIFVIKEWLSQFQRPMHQICEENSKSKRNSNSWYNKKVCFQNFKSFNGICKYLHAYIFEHRFKIKFKQFNASILNLIRGKVLHHSLVLI